MHVLDLMVLSCLTEWRTASEVAEMLGVDLHRVVESLRRLEREGRVWVDGCKYLRRSGISTSE